MPPDQSAAREGWSPAPETAVARQKIAPSQVTAENAPEGGMQSLLAAFFPTPQRAFLLLAAVAIVSALTLLALGSMLYGPPGMMVALEIPLLVCFLPTLAGRLWMMLRVGTKMIQRNSLHVVLMLLFPFVFEYSYIVRFWKELRAPFLLFWGPGALVACCLLLQTYVARPAWHAAEKARYASDPMNIEVERAKIARMDAESNDEPIPAKGNVDLPAGGKSKGPTWRPLIDPAPKAEPFTVSRDLSIDSEDKRFVVPASPSRFIGLGDAKQTQVWDLTSGQIAGTTPLTTTNSHLGYNSVLHASGKLIAGWLSRDEIAVFDVAKGEQIWRRKYETHSAYLIGFNAQDLIIGNVGGKLDIFDLTRPEPKRTDPKRTLTLNATYAYSAISPGGRYLAFGELNAAHLIDLTTLEHFVLPDIVSASHFSFSPDGCWLTAINGGDIWLWNLENQELQRWEVRPPLNNGSILASQWNPDSTQLAVWGKFLIDPKTGKMREAPKPMLVVASDLECELPKSGPFFDCVRLHHAGMISEGSKTEKAKEAATAIAQKTPMPDLPWRDVRDPVLAELIPKIPGNISIRFPVKSLGEGASPEPVAVRRAGRYLPVALRADKKLLIELRDLNLREQPANGLEVDLTKQGDPSLVIAERTGKYIAIAWDNTIDVYDVAARRSIGRLFFPNAHLSSARLLSNGAILAIAGDLLEIQHPKKQTAQVKIDPGSLHVDVSPAERFAAVWQNKTKRIEVFSIENEIASVAQLDGSNLAPEGSPATGLIAFSPNGLRLAALTTDSKSILAIYDLKTGQMVASANMPNVQREEGAKASLEWSAAGDLTLVDRKWAFDSEGGLARTMPTEFSDSPVEIGVLIDAKFWLRPRTVKAGTISGYVREKIPESP